MPIPSLQRQKETCLMQRSRGFGHGVAVSKSCYNTVIVLSVVWWDCCKPTNSCRDWAFSNSGLEAGLPAFQLPMFSKCDAPLNALPKGDLCDMIRHVCGAFTNQWAVVQIELLAKVGWHLPRNVTLELHQVLHLPRSVTLELHKVLHLPRNVTLELYQVLRRPRKVTLELHQVLRLPHKVTLELHQVLHWPRKVTLELHQVLGLPRKVTIEPHQLLHLPRKVIDNARSNRCHPPTSPNTAHATNNDIATFHRKFPKTDQTSFPMRSDHDPTMIRPWSENDPTMIRPWNRQSATRLATEVTFQARHEHFSIEKYNVSHPILHSNIHHVLRLPQKVTLELHQVLHRPRKVTLELHQVLRLPHKVTLELHQVLHWPRKVTLELHQVLGLPRNVKSELHQVLRLPRKMTRLLYPPRIWNVIYNARSNRCHPPTSPNTATATKNDTATATCHRTFPKTDQTSFPMRGRSDHDLTMIRPCHEKWHLNFTKYWDLNIANRSKKEFPTLRRPFVLSGPEKTPMTWTLTGYDFGPLGRQRLKFSIFWSPHWSPPKSESQLKSEGLWKCRVVWKAPCHGSFRCDVGVKTWPGLPRGKFCQYDAYIASNHVQMVFVDDILCWQQQFLLQNVIFVSKLATSSWFTTSSSCTTTREPFYSDLSWPPFLDLCSCGGSMKGRSIPRDLGSRNCNPATAPRCGLPWFTCHSSHPQFLFFFCLENKGKYHFV